MLKKNTKKWIKIGWPIIFAIILFAHFFYEPIFGIDPYNVTYTDGFFAAGDYARGFFAAGRFAVGVVAAGTFSVGIVSVGLFSIGIFSMGLFSIGFYSVGIFLIAKHKDTILGKEREKEKDN